MPKIIPLDERIVPFSSEYRSQVIDLHKQEFSRYIENHDALQDRLLELLTPDKTLIALVNDRLAGFICFSNISSLKYFQTFVNAALYPEYCCYNFDRLAHFREKGFTGEPIIQPLEYENLDNKVRKSDVMVSEFAVHSDFRKNGIGKNLATAALEWIKSQHASCNVYATIVEGSYAYSIALELGFTAFVKISPFYEDLSSMIAMVKKIN